MAKKLIVSVTKLIQSLTLPPAVLRAIFQYLPHESVEEAQKEKVIAQRSFAETCSLFKTSVQAERWKQRLVGCYASGKHAKISHLLKRHPDLDIQSIPDTFFIPRLVEFS
jgi:ribosomal 50S subunit-associated protein YjgA (DUF615 family)